MGQTGSHQCYRSSMPTSIGFQAGAGRVDVGVVRQLMVQLCVQILGRERGAALGLVLIHRQPKTTVRTVAGASELTEEARVQDERRDGDGAERMPRVWHRK